MNLTYDFMLKCSCNGKIIISLLICQHFEYIHYIQILIYIGGRSVQV